MASRVKELADAEADRVELEEIDGRVVDTETGEVIEPETEAVVEAEDAGLSMEALMAAFEKENDRHAAELELIMGDDFAAFEPCGICDAVGYRPTVAMPTDPTLSTCTECKGHGYLLTGSARPDKSVRECITCMGNGYVVKVDPPPAYVAPAVPVQMFDPFTGQPLNQANTGLPVPADSSWAPGYVPQAQAAPVNGLPR